MAPDSGPFSGTETSTLSLTVLVPPAATCTLATSDHGSPGFFALIEISGDPASAGAARPAPTIRSAITTSTSARLIRTASLSLLALHRVVVDTDQHDRGPVGAHQLGVQTPVARRAFIALHLHLELRVLARLGLEVVAVVEDQLGDVVAVGLEVLGVPTDRQERLVAQGYRVLVFVVR